MRRTLRLARLGTCSLLALLALAIAAPAFGQSTTSTIRGTVTADSGPVSGARVVAKSLTSGFEFSSTTTGDGKFQLPGLPPGRYEIAVEHTGHATVKETVQVLLGQDVPLTFRLTPSALMVENVTVVGDRVVETTTSEVATSVTTEQMQILPQNDRNFLNFAQLAPGIRVSTDPMNKQVRALGQPADATNVFIDGVSYKNDIQPGGLVGQDSSRGNPFPQNAVQEFQVLTQNFKAEYEKVGSSVISAVTKTGGNVWSGNVFGYYQNKDMVAKDYFTSQSGAVKPDYKRLQAGFDIGGPIIKDKLTVFVSYEENDQDRASLVTLGSNVPEGFDITPFEKYEGNITSPFRSHLAFAKLAWQPTLSQTVEFTYNWRSESDVRDYGGQTSYESATDEKIDTNTASLKHKWFSTNWLNEASFQWQSSKWNPTALNFNLPGQNYFGFIRIGGRDAEQDIVQDRLSLREDFTYYFTGAGRHALKAGIVLSDLKYDVTKPFTGNPVFNYDNNPAQDKNFDAPFEAFYATGDPTFDDKNKQYGVYVQDDWNPVPKLTLNLGIRWDYESNMVNTEFVTPEGFREALAGDIPAENSVWNSLTDAERANYFSDGTNRKQPTDLFQPRIGFAYDFYGTGRTVLFGGAGRYYDRVVYNDFFDEKFRTQWRTYRFCFVNNIEDAGTIRPDCSPDSAIVWDPSYLSKDALDQLLESGQRQGKAEIFLLQNDTKVPYNDQYSLGIRHAFGNLLAELTGTRIRGYNGFSYIFGNRNLETWSLSDVSADYSNLILGTSDKRYWYDGFYIKLEKPLSAGGKWGFTTTYTRSKAKQQGNDAFSLDYATVKNYPIFPTPDDEPNKLVATGIFRIPWDVTLSSNLILGSGVAGDVTDCSQGYSHCYIKLRQIRPDTRAFIVGDIWGYRQMDLRAQKTFKLGQRQALGVSLDAFNIFNWDNFGCLDGWMPALPDTNAHFGKPSCTVGTPRAYQVGLTYTF